MFLTVMNMVTLVYFEPHVVRCPADGKTHYRANAENNPLKICTSVSVILTQCLATYENDLAIEKINLNK